MKSLPKCLEAVVIHSGQSKADRTKALKSIKSGNIAVVMTTPEMIIESVSCFNSFLYSLPPVAFVCLDEVHCIAEWSHNFRPSYLRICKVCMYVCIYRLWGESFGYNQNIGKTSNTNRSQITILYVYVHMYVHVLAS